MTIEFRDVHASYDANTPILKGVDFTVEDGEFVAFVGTNGAGKSTTMRLVNGLLKPDQGEVLIDGVPTTQLKTSELARRVGFLFQNPDSQICCNTVREELLFGFKALGALDVHAERRVDDIIAEFDFKPDDDPFLLNRGTRQLLALASIVVLGTPVVVLDEPTTGLDFRECVKVMGIIRRLHERGTTVVMVCHDMEVVADFADRVIVMSDGRVVAQGPTFDILRDRRTLEAASLVPPQIVDISMGLCAVRPDLDGTLVAAANTLNEMEAAVACALGKPDRTAAVPTYAPTAPGAEDADGIADARAAAVSGPGTSAGSGSGSAIEPQPDAGAAGAAGDAGAGTAHAPMPGRIPTSPVTAAGQQLNELLDAAYLSAAADGDAQPSSPAARAYGADAGAGAGAPDVALDAAAESGQSDDSLEPLPLDDRPAVEPVDAIGLAVPGTVSEAGGKLVASGPSAEGPSAATEEGGAR